MKRVFEEIKDKLAKRHSENRHTFHNDAWNVGIEQAEIIINQAMEEMIPGEISDGFHTFNELYHHRAVLFSVICNQHKTLAWKSLLHETGDMYEGMFIVGIETPEGQATYHYNINPYWAMFDVRILPCAPRWDGHTPEDAIKRILSLTELGKKGQK